MPHFGKVKLKTDLINQDDVIIERGTVGIVTAYLPKDRIFSVYFGPGKWITFTKESEADFETRFKWITPHSDEDSYRE